MPRSKAQFEEMRNETKAKIHASAMKLFVDKGFGATNVQEIADSAGISIGLLYRHYKTKDALFSDLVVHSLSGMKEVISLFEGDDSPKKKMVEFANGIYDDMQNGDDLANRLMLMAQTFLSGADIINQNEIIQLDLKLLQVTANLITKGQATGAFRNGDAYEMAEYFFSSIQGLAVMKIMMKDRFIMPKPTIILAFLIKEGD